MEYYVSPSSIVRTIWGSADNILFIFTGASAEFALNKAVDWLYFTGRLPADPLGRLFSTVSYARKIVFSERQAAIKAIDQITAIHKGVENSRGAQIPDWAYRDVLFMLIDYSIRSFEVLERQLSRQEKEEVFTVFAGIGERMQIGGLPLDYSAWLNMRNEHLHNDLICSNFTIDLFNQYKKQLGPARFHLLKQVQVMLVPETVSALLHLGRTQWLKPVVGLYKWSRVFGIGKWVRSQLLAKEYREQLATLEFN